MTHEPQVTALVGGHLRLSALAHRFTSCALVSSAANRKALSIGDAGSLTLSRVIFKGVREGRPYPDHDVTTIKQWAEIAPRLVRLDQLVTTRRTLDLGALLAEDSTFYGDLFAHVVQYEENMYLEDGLHRAVRAALQGRRVLHARVLELELEPEPTPEPEPAPEPEPEPS